MSTSQSYTKNGFDITLKQGADREKGVINIICIDFSKGQKNI